jgi:hypothetical protein
MAKRKNPSNHGHKRKINHPTRLDSRAWWDQIAYRRSLINSWPPPALGDKDE